METFAFGPSFEEDLEIGFGTIAGVTLPDGSLDTLTKIGIQSFAGIVNARDFPSIQSAITALAAFTTAGTVHLEAGTHTLPAAALTSSIAICLSGAHRDTTIVYQPNLGVDGWNIPSGCRMSDLTFRGPGADSLGNSGLDSGSATDVVIENCIIEDWGDAGINTGGESSRWFIRSCIIRNNRQQGVFLGLGTSDCIIEGNEVYGNFSNGIDVNGSRNVIANNQVRANGASGGTADCFGILIAAVPGADASYNLVSSNIVTANASIGIIVKPTTSQATSYNIIIGNTSSSNGPSANADGINLDGSSAGTITYNVVDANICIGNTRYGIVADGSTSTVSLNMIRNNVCIANGNTGILITGGCLDTQLTGNTALSNTSAQITDNGTRTTAFLNKVQTSDGRLYASQLGLNLTSGAYGILDVRSGSTGTDGIFLGETTNGWLLTEQPDASLAFKITASGAPQSSERLNLSNPGDLRVIGGLLAGGPTPSLLGYLCIGTTQAFGGGAPVTLTSQAYTGDGPVNAGAVVNNLKITINNIDFWIPLLQ